MFKWLRELFRPLEREVRTCERCGKNPALADSAQCRQCAEDQAFRL